MSGTDDGEKRSRGAGRSGSAGSIGKELGDDLEFEADALLDSLLAGEAPAQPGKKSVRPGTPGAATPQSEPPPPSEAGMLHAPDNREFPDDEPTWVGNIDEATGLDVQALAAKAGLGQKPKDGLRPPPPHARAPAIPVLPPPPSFAPPRPGGVPRPGVSSVPRPGSRAPTPARGTRGTLAGTGNPQPPAVNPAGPPPRQPYPPAMSPATPYATPVPPARELPVFGGEHDDEVTRVQGIPTLHDIDGFLERTARASPGNATTARPPAGVQEAHIQTSAQPLEELSLDNDDDSLPTSSSAAIASLSELSFDDGVDELLDATTDARLDVAGSAELSEAELEALAAAD